jgi:hypothetical protein
MTKNLSWRGSHGDRETLMPVLSLPLVLREDLEDAPFWKEVLAYTRIPQNYLDKFLGRYVAVYQGKIVDFDRDEERLARRFFSSHGFVSVYIHRVGVEDDVIDLEKEPSLS